ncbi:hypothetical protein Enr17x_57890 [Gimesia fumaroli]|uniref:Uncharacterized protein n=1 Tax=Gimesia fumaroli TaxID=2527976 RepID=A0A518IKT2_9PLAN|nr:hypothetical protein Enr17x_57890 [Gimesia fumaroli]
MSTTKARKKTGRPKGKKTQDLPVVEISATHCPKCKSTERTGYRDVRTMEHSGIAPGGYPYNFISWKRTECLKCGQHRIDKKYENVI